MECGAEQTKKRKLTHEVDVSQVASNADDNAAAGSDVVATGSAGAATSLSSEPHQLQGADSDKSGDFVLVEMDDVPRADSPRILAALPPLHAVESLEAGGREQKVLLQNREEDDSGGDADPLFKRLEVHNGAITQSTVEDSLRVFSLVSYNILAECHIHQECYPFSGPDLLAQDYRHTRLLKELDYLDGDILCLQEVGPKYFADVLLPTLKSMGYEGAFIKRVDDAFDEGEATFYRSSRFSLIESQPLVTRDILAQDMSALAPDVIKSVCAALDSAGVALVTKLRCNYTSYVVTVANIHVIYNSFKRPDIQCTQVSSTIRQLVSCAGDVHSPHIICGDFNSWPGSVTYKCIQSGHLDNVNAAPLLDLRNVDLSNGKMSSAFEVWEDGFHHPSSALMSAYQTCLGKEPLTSRFPSDGISRNVDFIWYSSDSLQLASVLDTVPETCLREGIPNVYFPSDHVSLKARFIF